MPEEWTTEGELAYNKKQAFVFYKTRKKLALIHSHTFTPRAQAKITWILQAYGHVLSDVGIYTPGEFAAKIKEAYDVSNEHNALAVSILTDMDEFMVSEVPLRIKKG